MILEGRSSADIAAGICDHTGRYVLALMRDQGTEKDICFTGGVAKNPGIIRYLEQNLQTRLVELPVDPQLIGAIGAALFAADEYRS